MGNGVTVLAVDDEAAILEVVGAYLEREGYSVLTARTGRRALQIAESGRVSLLLLDLMLPDIPGEEVCRLVRERSDIPVIMMTAKADEESVVAGLAMGADDYVTKPFSPRQLVARVAAAMRRSAGLAGFGDTGRRLRVEPVSRSVVKDGEPVSLTPGEYRILSLLMSSPGRIFTRDEIIAAVKSDDYGGFDCTVDSHVKNLRRKIEDDRRAPRYVVTAHGFGYRWGGGQ